MADHATGSDELTRTPLTERHEAMGARMGPFAGWWMPVEFSGTVAEHQAVRSDVGVFDVSHLGTVDIVGADAEAVVAASFTNDPAAVADGASQYTLCATEDGGVLDDLIVYRLAARHWVAVPNAANTAAVLDVLAEASAGRDAEVRDRSLETAVIAVQGPRSLDLVADALAVEAGDIPYLQVAETTLAGQRALVCRTGYTGERGVELVVPAPAAVAVHDALLEAGATACGLGARDTLRLEMGYPLHGSDLGPRTSPVDARLGWAVKLDRAPFRGQQALRAAKEAGPARRLLGVRASGRRPLRAGMAVLAASGMVGTLTSGGYSPTLAAGIGLGYLATGVEPGDAVAVDVRGREVAAEVVRPPFVDRDPRR